MPRPLVVLALLAAVPFSGSSMPASAQTLDTRPWGTSGYVHAIERVGDRLYVGGDFGWLNAVVGAGVPVDRETGTPLVPYPRVAVSVGSALPDGEGGWFIAGNFFGVGGKPRRNLAHILADGSVSDWAPDPDRPVHGLQMVRGTLYVAGPFTEIAGQPRRGLAAFDLRTGALTPWQPAPNGPVYALLATNHTLYVSGDFDWIGGAPRRHLAEVDLRTGRATPWSSETAGYVFAMALQGGTLFVGGDFSSIGGQPRLCVAALDATTGALRDWDAHLDGPSYWKSGQHPVVYGLAVADRSLYVAGYYTRIGTELRGGIAQLDLRTGAPTAWNPIPVTDPDNLHNPFANRLLLDGRALIVQGSFTTFDGRPAGGAVEVDLVAGTITDLGPRTGGANILAVTNEAMYLGGWVRNTPSHLRVLDGFAELDLATGAPTGWDPSLHGDVYTFARRGDTLYVAGDFTSVLGQPRANLAAIDLATHTLLPWAPETDDVVTAMSLAGNTLYVVGGFETAGDEPRHRLAAFDATTGAVQPWNPGTSANAPPNAIVADPSTVYVGGVFGQIGGQPRRNLAALDAVTGLATPWNPVVDGWVETLALHDGVLHVGGYFQSVNGTPRSGLAAVDAASGEVTPWNPAPDGPVLALAVGGDRLYAGGRFRHVGGEPRTCLAAFDLASGALTPWSVVTENHVDEIAVGAGAVYFAGPFNFVGFEPVSHLAAVSADASSLRSLAAARPATPARNALALAPCAPNPVRGRATLRFALPDAGPVTFAVYDLQGRRVASLLDGRRLTAGEHQVAVDARHWPAGVYLYRLQAGGVTLTRRLLVVK